MEIYCIIQQINYSNSLYYPYFSRPNSYCSVYTIPTNLFQEEELELTSVESEEPVTERIQ